ncbi:MAG: PAS domain-containing sensor histidine kinase [Bryobacterales bacterium]|nr:PAS domain-containing sensor histidine kinase [Bryobacterales bacterium]
MEHKERISHERRTQLLALAAGLPSVIFSAFILCTGDYPPKVLWTAGLILGGSWLGFSAAVRDRVANPLRTIANLLEAMREGDYSIRARGATGDDALSDVMQQVNAMGATLRSQRLGAMEATTLLRKVMEEIDVAIFAFDESQKLKLLNRAAERLLALPAERAIDRHAAQLDLASFLTGDDSRTVQRAFPGGFGRWGITRASFREGGLPHHLLVITDLTRPLREEELQAWQRLVRVLGHELNNSLTPIKSIAGSLETILKKDPLPADWHDDMTRGLSIIGSRAESLARFIGAYAKLARLPRPVLAPLPIAPVLQRTARMETRVPVTVEPGPDLVIQADSDQLEQVIINLLRNAADAMDTNRGTIVVRWRFERWQLVIDIEDDGPGLAATANLFVPFFTTKPGGSGIGLVLCRQIVEAHGGTLSLTNRDGARGCLARLLLPCNPSPESH